LAVMDCLKYCDISHMPCGVVFKLVWCFHGRKTIILDPVVY
jgi:hypothetical protein